VDVGGSEVGMNRPDIQYDKGGKHYNVEYDTTAAGSTNHQRVVPGNDPKARSTFWEIDSHGNKVTGRSCV
jgi:hypothetical protein